MNVLPVGSRVFASGIFRAMYILAISSDERGTYYGLSDSPNGPVQAWRPSHDISSAEYQIARAS